MLVTMAASINISVIFLHLCCCLTLLTLLFDVGICRGGSSSEPEVIKCIPSEREALLKVKHHLKDPSNRLSSWNDNTNCCHWAGVVCSNVTAHVLELHLNNTSPPSDPYASEDAYEAYERSMFGGELHPSLVDLKHLNYLDLSGNNFGDMQIPSFLGEITTLTYLNFSRAGFQGKIPHQIGNLTNLIYLDLKTTYPIKFSEVPYQIGNLTNLLHLDLGIDYRSELSLFIENLHWLSGLSSLQYLDLSSVNLSKSIDWLQAMQALPSLEELHLSSCPLHHYILPSTLNFSSLLTLDLSYSHNLGTSFFPNWIFGLTKLVSLQLYWNKIQGPIPDGIQNLTLLENLDLSSNLFSSSIPDWLYGLHHLKILYLDDNNLHGTISSAIGNLTSLASLVLSYNYQLEGKIPTSIGNLCNLRGIDFSYLKLNQKLSEILKILTPCVSHGLELLHVHSSQLSGHLTDQIGIFKNLISLDFSNNTMYGKLPRSLGELSSLRSLILYKNQFNGNPFEILRSLYKLTFLELEGNMFQGIVKEADLANFRSLKRLYASGNNLTLKVGPNWSPTFQAEYLEMSSWHLGPDFPMWIQSQKKLLYLEMSNTEISDSIPGWFWETFPYDAYHLNLSHNHIHGELTNTLKNPNSLYTIDLSSNDLSGQLPNPSINVTWLDLSDNLFSGSMTNFLCQKRDKSMGLEFLNLASNKLSGEIPDCWTMWPNLVDVNLQSNYFVGNLPPSMGSLAALQSLQIRNNSLSGNFPSILKNTSKLISLDLGENKLTGIIPSWVGERLVNLKTLRLRSNEFSGHIPNQICALNLLQDLDLAQNKLTGNIPNCFNHLNAMMIKNRSSDLLIRCPMLNGTRSSSIVSLLVWLKGRDIEYSNLLGLVTSIDLSNNKLSGEIPREITNLDGLISLNLSNNHLTGKIPQSIGNMRLLESIDFSKNQLSDEIPSTMTNLTFLSKLDLSYNHLNGKIPTGTQLQSFEASSFVGNNLCGPPLLINCSSCREIPNDDHRDKERNGHEVNWLFFSMAFGFIVGFWVVVAPLFIYRSWRHSYFRFLDDSWYKLQSCW